MGFEAYENQITWLLKKIVSSSTGVKPQVCVGEAFTPSFGFYSSWGLANPEAAPNPWGIKTLELQNSKLGIKRCLTSQTYKMEASH